MARTPPGHRCDDCGDVVSKMTRKTIMTVDDAYDYHSPARLSHVVTISTQQSGFNTTPNRQEVVLVDLSFVSVASVRFRCCM